MFHKTGEQFSGVKCGNEIPIFFAIFLKMHSVESKRSKCAK